MHKAILYLALVIFLKISSQKTPTVSSIHPIVIKSELVQTTSFVNSIATRGISNSAMILARITRNLLFFILMSLKP